LAQEAAEQFAIQAILTPVHDFAEIEAVITNIAADALSGLVLPQDSFTSVHRKLIVALAAHYRLPAVYAFDGGNLALTIQRLP
jgi:putative ABC transport system substrate-binding protein